MRSYSYKMALKKHLLHHVKVGFLKEHFYIIYSIPPPPVVFSLTSASIWINLVRGSNWWEWFQQFTIVNLAFLSWLFTDTFPFLVCFLHLALHFNGECGVLTQAEFTFFFNLVTGLCASVPWRASSLWCNWSGLSVIKGQWNPFITSANQLYCSFKPL